LSFRGRREEREKKICAWLMNGWPALRVSVERKREGKKKKKKNTQIFEHFEEGAGIDEEKKKRKKKKHL